MWVSFSVGGTLRWEELQLHLLEGSSLHPGLFLGKPMSNLQHVLCYINYSIFLQDMSHLKNT